MSIRRAPAILTSTNPFIRFLSVLTSSVAFVLRDDFTTNASAPLTTPRTCEPGPGTLTITDTGNNLSIVNSTLRISTSSQVGTSSVTATLAAGTSGRTLTFTFPRVVTNGGTNGQIGYTGNSTYWPVSSSQFGISNPIIQYGGLSTSVGPHYIVAYTTGFLYISTIGATTKLMWHSVAETTIKTAFSIAYNGAGGARDYDIDNVRIWQAAAPLNAEYGIVTQRLAGARAINDTFTHEANCFIEFTCTTRPSSGNMQMAFRKQDASNYWMVQINSSGDLTLQEVVAGTPTQRGSSAGVVSSGHRITIRCNDAEIRLTSNNTTRITYTSATNFQTATAGILLDTGTSGAVSDIIVWPVDITGTTLSALQAGSA